MSGDAESRHPGDGALPGADRAIRRVVHAVLATAVRGRRGHGGPWGEAVLAEFHLTRGGWEAFRWAAGGMRTVWRERRESVRRGPRYDRIGRRVALAAVLTLIVGTLVNQYVLSTRFVPSGSMRPTLQARDRFVLDRVSFRFTGIHHNDIVVFTERPDGADAGHEMVKRVVGLPGDTLSCRDGRIFRNGTELLDPHPARDAQAPPPPGCPTVTVPAGQLYVLGDRRDLFLDSRQIGPVEQDAVTGRMLVRVWPLTHRPA